ncbi:hypothetical protein C8R44DRAFT_846911 [Mycena epipterygia]|nr:hypothetical protein C8R44DRAFT_846911 [Mycena epipterygia]
MRVESQDQIREETPRRLDYRLPRIRKASSLVCGQRDGDITRRPMVWDEDAMQVAARALVPPELATSLLEKGTLRCLRPSSRGRVRVFARREMQKSRLETREESYGLSPRRVLAAPSFALALHGHARRPFNLGGWRVSHFCIHRTTTTPYALHFYKNIIPRPLQFYTPGLGVIGDTQPTPSLSSRDVSDLRTIVIPLALCASICPCGPAQRVGIAVIAGTRQDAQDLREPPPPKDVRIRGQAAFRPCLPVATRNFSPDSEVYASTRVYSISMTGRGARDVLDVSAGPALYRGSRNGRGGAVVAAEKEGLWKVRQNCPSDLSCKK